jgi:hypothetical protein
LSNVEQGRGLDRSGEGGEDVHGELHRVATLPVQHREIR